MKKLIVTIACTAIVQFGFSQKVKFAAVLTALKGVRLQEASKIERANDPTIYGAQVKGKDLRFDKDGNRVDG